MKAILRNALSAIRKMSVSKFLKKVAKHAAESLRDNAVSTGLTWFCKIYVESYIKKLEG